MDTWVTSTSCGIFPRTVKNVAINMGVQISFLDPAFSSLGYTVDSWTTWVWTVLVHLYADFLHHLQLADSTDMHYRYRETQGFWNWSCRHRGTTVYPELWDHMVILFLVLGGTVIPFFIAAAPFYFPSKRVSVFHTFSPTIVFCVLFLIKVLQYCISFRYIT